MRLSAEVFEHKLCVNNILESGCLLDLLDSVTICGSKELLTIFAEQNGFDRLMESDRRQDVLSFFIDLATILVNSYDERMGIVSALVYYLSERDRYSIDIEWGWQDVRRFEKFILWLEPLLRSDEERPRALQLLEFVLSNFPPLRVTPNMLQALNTTIPTILAAARDFVKSHSSTFNNEQTRFAVTTSTIVCLPYFGLGIEFREYLRTDLIVSDYYFPKLEDRRCPDSFCELLRRARQALRERNESPISQNTPLALQLLVTMKDSGCLFRDALGFDSLFSALEDVADSSQKGIEDQGGGAVFGVDLDNALLNLFTLDMVWNMRFPHNSKSSSSEAPFASDLRRLSGLLEEKEYFEKFFKLILINKGQQRTGGLPRGLGLWVVFHLQNNPISEKSLQWLMIMCKGILSSKSQGSTSGTAPRPFDDGLMLPFIATLHHAYQNSLVLRPNVDRRSADSSQYCADEYVCSWSTEYSELVGEAISTLIGQTNSYCASQVHPPATDWLKRNLFHLSCCLSVVCGLGEYAQVPEARRHVIFPAGGPCGRLTDVCRVFLNITERIDSHACCYLIKWAGNLCLKRAQQSSGLELLHH